MTRCICSSPGMSIQCVACYPHLAERFNAARAPKHRADVPVDSCRHLRLTWQSMCHYCTDCGMCAPTHRADVTA